MNRAPILGIRPDSVKNWFFAGLIVIAVVGAYYPGLHGPFLFDDSVSITNNPDVAIESLDYASLRQATLSNDSGIFKRPLAALSFALNHYIAGGFANTFPFKVTNLIIHLINTGLIYWLSILLLAKLRQRPGFRQTRLHRWLPAIIAAIWALHPLQLTTVLYVVQRMTSLSALFVLIGLIIFIYGRERIREQRVAGVVLMAAGLVGGTVLGITSKENAALLPLFILLVEFLFFYETYEDAQVQRTLKWFYGLSILIACLLALSVLIIRPDVLSGAYRFREFTMLERLLTESRVLWFYVGLILLPNVQHFTLFHDDIPLSDNLFEPWTTFIALTGLILIAVSALLARRRYTVFSFSVLWFLIGHSMESSFIGLEIAHEHRNYLSDFGPIFGVVYGLAAALNRFKTVWVSTIIFGLVVITLAFSTFTRANIWASEKSITDFLVRRHPNSARAHALLAERYTREGHDALRALKHYKIASDLAPHETSHLIRMVHLAALAEVRKKTVNTNGTKIIASAKIPSLPQFVSIEGRGSQTRLILEKSITDRITKQLASQPVTSRVEQTLRELAGCTLQPDDCAYLRADVIRWCQLATDNPRIPKPVLGNMLLTLVKLYLEDGDHDAALQAAKRATDLDPSSATFAVMKANVYFLRNELDKAEQILMPETTVPSRLKPSVAEEADRLRSMIKARREVMTSD